MTLAPVGLGLALLLAYWATPLAIRVADHFEFYDRPVGYKGHAAPTPYLGGAAVVGAFLVALVALTGDWDRTLPLVGGVALLWVVGTVDDRRTVSPGLRVVVEIALAGLLWQLGLGWELGAGGLVDLLVTAFWVVAVVNAFNLFDNMDGAATSMAGVAAGGLAILGAVEGDTWLAVTGATLAGACLGFLPHNLLRSPARIFLGDGGSMPVGFAVAALAMIGLTGSAPAWQSLAMGLLFVGIPALDTCLVVFSRTRRGISVLTGGRDHLTHRARSRLHTARAVAITLGAAQAVVSALAVVALQGGSSVIVLAVAVYLVGLGVAMSLLDTRLAPEVIAGGGAAPGEPPVRTRPAFELLVPAALVPVGLVAGLSPFASGYYSSGLWVPAGLVVIALTTALVIARPARLTRPATLALGALTALALWALASAAWADSVPQAMVEANRLLAYAVGLGGLLLLVRGDRAAAWLLGAVAAGALTVALVVIARMLGGETDLFLNGRLDQPLGYINGEASLFLVGLWASFAAVDQRRSAWLAGAGAAACTLLGALLILSQSRGVALAALTSLLVVALVAPGRVRRFWSLAAIAAGVGVAAPFALDVYTDTTGGAIRDAALATLAGAILAGVGWGLLSTVQGGRRVATIAMAAVLVLMAGAGVVSAARIAGTLDRQYQSFVHLGIEPQGSSTDSGSRLVSGAGNRYDYWRVAWQAFGDKPVAGWGAGNFDGPYFQRRATSEDIRQPHSVQLQALAELGLVGGLLLLTLIGAVAWAAWRTRAGAFAAAATGMVTAWLVHTSVDWIHLLPGITLAALAGVAVLVRPRSASAPAAVVAPRRPRLAWAAGVAVVLALAGLSLTRQGMTDHFRGNAEDVLAADPGRALLEADRALRLDPDSVPAYYVKSAALARFDEPEAARGALEEAARREPRDFVTWALLGDLSVRAGDLAGARRDYARAHALNPRDPVLAEAARDPRP